MMETSPGSLKSPHNSYLWFILSGKIAIIAKKNLVLAFRTSLRAGLTMLKSSHAQKRPTMTMRHLHGAPNV